MQVVVTFPDELLIALKEKPDSFSQKVLLYTLGKLYEMGHISGGLAAQVMKCSRWEFYHLLSQNGFAVIDYTDDELEQEALVEDIWYEVTTP